MGRGQTKRSKDVEFCQQVFDSELKLGIIALLAEVSGLLICGDPTIWIIVPTNL
jgi:hypothetical protein